MAKKPSKEREPEAQSTMGPIIIGFGLEEREGKFLACRISSAGAVNYLGPKSSSGYRPESKSLALSRMMEAIKEHYAPSRNLRLT